MGVAGHQLMANITNAYIDHQLCEMVRWESQPGNSGKTIEELYPYPSLPRVGPSHTGQGSELT